MSLDIFGTENQMVQLESDFSDFFVSFKRFLFLSGCFSNFQIASLSLAISLNRFNDIQNI